MNGNLERKSPGLMSASLVALLVLGSTRVGAQTFQYEALHHFRLGPTMPWAGLTRGSDGYLYGTTSRGGASGRGTVFKMNLAGDVTVLHSFTATEGAFPVAPLIEGADGNFYGTTAYGGNRFTGPDGKAHYGGTVFKMDPAGAVVVLHAFLGGADGAWPSGELTQASDGSLYGTTQSGGNYITPPAGDGQYYGGTIFKISPTGSFTTLHAFTATEGADPYAGLTEGGDGSFYGTTIFGPVVSLYANQLGFGSVFKITPAGAFTTLHYFAVNDGAFPYGHLLKATDGNLYGTTYGGGLSDPIVKSDLLRVFVADFLAGIAGTSGSGAVVAMGFGTVFKIDSQDIVTPYYLFKGTLAHPVPGSGGIQDDGLAGNPLAGLIQGSDGSFYGTSVGKQSGNSGSAIPRSGYGPCVFRLPSQIAAPQDFHLKVLHHFGLEGPRDGNYPFGALVETSEGNLYGTTTWSGENAYDELAGTAFRITTSGATTTLHSFGGGLEGSGLYPSAALVKGADGTFYSTTRNGGAGGEGYPKDAGTMFQLTGAGTVTTIQSLPGSGDLREPMAPLLRLSDGSLCGTTLSGGNGGGGVFKVSVSGNLQMLWKFGDSASPTGADPVAGVIWGSDGSLYGTTAHGGDTVCYINLAQGKSVGCGAVFKIDPTGGFSVLHSFNILSDAAYPRAALLEGSDGNFYGTTQDGGDTSKVCYHGEFGSYGSYGCGIVFRMDAAASVTTLSSFAGGGDGGNPVASLIEGSDGRLYGTTREGGGGDCTNIAGGAMGCGTIFALDSTGRTTLHSLTKAEGSAPSAALIEASDGNFYGTTRDDGPNGYGTVFKMDPTGNVTVLHAFAGSDDGGIWVGQGTGTDGANPVAALVQGDDGHLYGTTSSGGQSEGGVLFRMLAPTKITSVGGSPQTTQIGKPFPLPLTVRVTDRAGVPLPGQQVTLVVPAAGASSTGAIGPVVTDASGLASVTATANAVPGTYNVKARVDGALSAVFVLTNTLGSPGLNFYTVTPCRVLDTRQTGGTLSSGAPRALAIAPSCGIPATAKAVSFNLTATAPTADGSVAFYADSGPAPVAATLHFKAGKTSANNQVLGLASNGSGVLQATASVLGGGSVHVLVDVNGYFQ